MREPLQWGAPPLAGAVSPPGGAPLRDGPEHLTRLRVAPQFLLGEDDFTVHRHLEHASRRLDERDLGVRVGLTDLGRQTGGQWLVVSDDAVFDRDPHEWNHSRA